MGDELEHYREDITSWGDLEHNYAVFKKKSPWTWRGIKIGLGALALGICGISSCYTVGPDEEGVVRRFGKYASSSTPGLHAKLPFIDKVDFVQVTEIKKQEFGFRTTKSGVQSEYDQETDFSKEKLMLTGDKSIVDLEFIVQYKVKSAKDYLFNVRNVDETLRDAAEAAMRMEIGDRGIDDALTSGRVEIQNDVEKRLQNIVDSYNSGIHILTVKLQDVRPPRQVDAAFNRVNEAKQEKTKMVNNAWEAYNKVIPKARGQAENTIKHAHAYALERVNKAKGDANKFTEVRSKYQAAKSITQLRMYLETMTKIMPGFKEKIIIEEEAGKGVLKLLDIGANNGYKNPLGGKKK